MKKVLGKTGLEYTLNKLKTYLADKDIRTTVPIGGSITWYGAENTIPVDYMREDGRSLNKNEYPELFNIIGYTYGGSGDTFNLPDSRGKVIVHLNETDNEFNTIGKTYGEKSHTLTVDEMPSHNHSIKAVYGGLSEGDVSSWSSKIPAAAGGNPWCQNLLNDQSDFPTVQYSGNNQSHNNIQPSLVAYRIIKVKSDAYTENLRNLDTQVNSLKEQVNGSSAVKLKRWNDEVIQ